MDYGLMPFWSAIIGGAVGGVVCGGFTWWGSYYSTKKAHQNQMNKSKQDEEMLIKGLLQASYDETETLAERYEATMGPRIEGLEDGKPLLLYYPLDTDFFTVYNSNANLLGRIPDRALSKQIIKAYTMSKGMVDSFRYNNHLVQKYEDAIKLSLESNHPTHKQLSDAVIRQLSEYAKKLIRFHYKSKTETYTLLEELKKRIA